MKVIFLDFNGVLDTYENMDEINEDNLRRLKHIVDITDSKVVISSSLKNSYYYTGYFTNHMKYIMNEIKHIGIEIIGITPKAENREEEIKLYLKKHPEVEAFCILDDDYEMESLKENLVKLPSQNTIGQMGLNDTYMKQAIKILSKIK